MSEFMLRHLGNAARLKFYWQFSKYGRELSRNGQSEMIMMSVNTRQYSLTIMSVFLSFELHEIMVVTGKALETETVE